MNFRLLTGLLRLQHVVHIFLPLWDPHLLLNY